MNKSFNLAISITVILFSLFFYVPKAEALSVTPVRFELSGKPGDTLTEEILLYNEGEFDTTYYSSFTNFEAQGETGNPAFVEPTEGLGTWMQTAPTVVVPAGKSVPVPFQIRIPQNAEPGGHFAVVFFGDAPPSGSGVSIGSKLGILILLSVSGDVKEGGGIVSFNLKESKFFYNTLPVAFEYRFRNDGGDRIKPVGNVKIRNTFYIPTEKINANQVEGNILPNSTRRFDVSWVEKAREPGYTPNPNIFTQFFDDVLYQWHNFAFGFYFADLSLNYGVNLSMYQGTDTKIFFVFPWQLLIVMGFVLLIVFFGGGKLLSKYNAHIIEKAKRGMDFGSSQSHEK